MKPSIHFANLSSPPPKARRCACGGMWQLLVPLLLMFLSPAGLWAGEHFKNMSNHNVTHHPTISEPYVDIALLFYDTNGKDGFFKHNQAVAGHDGPAVYFDGKYFASPDYELAWPGSKNDGNSDGLEDQRKYDGQWRNTYSATIDNQRVTLIFIDPRKQSGKFYVTMRFSMNVWQAGVSHKIKIRGLWKINNTSEAWEEAEFTVSPISVGSMSVSAIRGAYNTVDLGGRLISSGGRDVTVAARMMDNPRKYIEPRSMSVQKTIKAADQEIKGLSMSCEDIDNSYYGDRKVYIQESFTSSGTVIWQGSEVTIHDYARSKNIELLPELWKKQLKVAWQADADAGQSTNGTWTIFRYPEGKASESRAIVERLSYKTRSYSDDVPEYDTKYVYEVVFMPNNTPDGKRYERLVRSSVAQVRREFNITDLNVLNHDKTIELNWKNPAFGGTEAYAFKIFRTEDANLKTGWEEVGTVAVSDKNLTEYSYTDSKSLKTCHIYYYKVQTTMLENYTFASDASLGGRLSGVSAVTAVSATKGDYNGTVKVSWDAAQVGEEATRYEVMRTLKGTDNWAVIHKTSGTATSYYYEDNTALPGQYYDYKVVSITSCEGLSSRLEKGDDGFCRATGIVSGRVAYGTGTAVANARVSLVRNNENSSERSQFYSLRTAGTGDGAFLSLGGEALNKQFAGKAYSVQMFVRPDDTQKGTTPTFFDLGGKVSLQLGAADDKGFPVCLSDGTNTENTGLYLQPLAFTSVTLSVGADGKATVTCINEADSVRTATATGSYKVSFGADADNGICMGGSYKPTAANAFSGYVDEMRVFSDRALTADDVMKYYNHSLTGTEDNLFVYWPVDEGISKQTTAYDYSKTSGVANGNHARLGPSTEPTNAVIPTERQFGLFGITDIQGNFVVRGVPFNGDGTNYMVVPELGIHEFSPSYSSRYVSASSLVHSGVDFEDVSSFPVSGKVRYAGTNYPVEGVQFYVDGTICSKDGKMLTSNEEGEFTISVPIGDHFIEAVKNGHVFVNAGRYPDDPEKVGKRINFNQRVDGLEFVDTTLVNLTGKVVGGDIEGGKTIGFGLSKNNLGVTELVLTPTNTKYNMNVVKTVSGTKVDYVINDKTVAVTSASADINSQAWRGAGSDDAKKIVIRTDSKTGEFSAMVPPLLYSVSAMKVVATGEKVGDATTIDLTDPTQETTDTLYTENKEVRKTYSFNRNLTVTYHGTPHFTVVQKGNTDGAFGVKEHTMSDALGEKKVDDIYSLENGKPVYKYGAPIFVEMDSYTFDIDAYEEYVNKDEAQNPVADIVPLRNLEVTVSNALSSEQGVYGIDNHNGAAPGTLVSMTDNTLTLDSLGHATYVWKAGLPNITEPYTRTISMSYDINDRAYMWEGLGANKMDGIILGFLPTGNNFVTEGPSLLHMILRDPPGTASSAQWTKGTVKSEYSFKGGAWSSENFVNTQTMLGTEVKALAGGIGFMIATESEVRQNLEVGVKVTTEGVSGNTWGSTVTAEKTISTSDQPEYIGAGGDLFIGSSNNLVYGLARTLGFQRDGDGVKLGVEDTYTTGLKFATEFAYSANYIENVLIPNLIDMRNSKLTYIDDVDNYTPTGDEVVFLTSLTSDDPRYGTSNSDKVWGKDAVNASQGKSYTMKVGNPKVSANDIVQWCNSQIANWESWLAANEEEKVKAYESREDNALNYSFDAGSSITYTATNEKSKGERHESTVMALAHVGFSSGLLINETGVVGSISTDTGGGSTQESESEESESSSFSYTFAETGDDDALTVDVYQYGKYSPIFRTRGGQTSGPYEGEVTTKYYRPGTVIMEATMQIEVPKIAVDVATVTDVPAGQPANYTLRMTNESQTNEDVYYKLMMIDETNPDGAMLSIDGFPLTDGRLVKIPAGETVTKALQLTQTNLGVLDYKNVGIVLASQSQYDPTSTWDQIADTCYVTARFAPSSSDVDMALSRTTLNSSVGDTVTISFDKFDRNYVNLKAFRIQYKRQGDTDWNLLREYVTDESSLTQNNMLLPDGSTVSFDLDMHNFSDGKYVFRTISVCSYGNSEVYKASNEIALVKDMQRPKPLGLPTPSNGVLAVGDDISVTFNENFIGGELTKNMNFLVTGVLNGATIDHATALNLDGMEMAAATEADINLAGKSFSLDMWINVHGKGTILTHGTGTDRLSVGLDEAQRLVMTIAGETYTSVNAMPEDKWAFLHIGYDKMAAGGRLNAAVAADDNTMSLFADTQAALYNGNGPLLVGNGINAAVHELTLWDDARSIELALAGRQKSKQPSTRHLVGYWKMTEGEGTSIRDYSRGRNMTMKTESWYLNNENKALELDGEHHVGVMLADCSPFDEDDYAVELWMRAGQQTGEAQLMHSGDVGLWLDADGLLKLSSGEETFGAGTLPLTDNAWHHVALNLLRNGSAAVYVDGERTMAVSARKVGNIASDSLYVGARRASFDEISARYVFDRHFKGQMDEIRVWNASMNAELLKANRKVRLTGKEEGLVAYYPFEVKTLDTYNQVVTNGSMADLVTGTHSAVMGQKPVYTDESPALRVKPEEENVEFSYTASDNKIVIDINEDENVIDGCTLNFTVRNVRDENGNYSKPVCWSAFVNRRELVWKESSLSMSKGVGDEAVLTATIVNNGGKQQMWRLGDLPSWLKADTEYGTAEPQSENQIVFTLGRTMAVGKYNHTVYLMGSDAVEVPLTIDVTVLGDRPAWTVDKSEYESSMNMIASLSILGKPSSDTDDVVAVFIGDECRGVASPVYNKRYDSHFVMLDIYGNPEDAGKPLSYRAYDASTGVTYPVLECSRDVRFGQNSMVGNYNEPVALNAINRLEQVNNLTRGWNWIGLSVCHDDMSMPSVLAPLGDGYVQAKSQNAFMEADGGVWYGSVITMNNREMYKLYASSAQTLKIVGDVPDAESRRVTVAPGWNWIAYNNTFAVALDEAFAGLQPQDGDIVKGQQGFALYDGYEWAGSLEALQPGQGYMLYSTASDSRTFGYPTASTGRKILGNRIQAAAAASRAFSPVDVHKYPNNMSIVALVKLDGEIAKNAEIGAFAGDECRTSVLTDANGLAYLSVPGDDRTPLTFRLADNGKVLESDVTLNYENDAMCGTTHSPYVISFGTGLGISSAEVDDIDAKAEWYTVSGVRLEGKPTAQGVYVRKYTDEKTGRTVTDTVTMPMQR